MAAFIFFACNSTNTNVDQEQPSNTEEIIVGNVEKPLKSFQQELPSDVFLETEEMPEFNGNLIEYLCENITYPDSAKIKGIEGTVYVIFIVEKDGTISNTEVIRGVSEELDNEALRVISEMPKWKPGKYDGQNVRVQYAIPIKFKLS